MNSERRANELGLLRKIVNEIVKQPLTSGPILPSGQTEAKLAHSTLTPAGYIGVTTTGNEALEGLAEAMLKRRSNGDRGVHFKGFRDRLFKQLIDQMLGKATSSLSEMDVIQLETEMFAWVGARTGRRVVMVPCILSPNRSNAFSIGPVKFVYRTDLKPGDLADDGSLPNAVILQHYDDFLDLATAERAFWIARTEIDNCDGDSGTEIADLTVDLAIVFFQLAYLSDQTRNMSRLSSRRGSARKLSLSISDNGSVYFGSHITEAGPALGDGMLEHIAQTASELRFAVGRIVTSFATGQYRFPVLEKAWCDAAYWLHQGLVEPVDAIAVAKLETAIEVLVRAESSTGSKRRTKKAIEGFLGIAPDKPLFKQRPETSEAIAARLVRDRSQVLHGTWSTLGSRMGEGRSILEPLVIAILKNYAIALEAYVLGPSTKDDIEDLIVWNKDRLFQSQVPAS